ARKMFRKVGDPDDYGVVGHEGPHLLQAGINNFSAHLQLRSGDVLGLHSGVGDCAFDAPGNTILFLRDTDLADGAHAPFQSDIDFRVNATAEVVPTSDFTLGKVKAKPNGTATVRATVPNPGNLRVSGNGVKGSVSAASAKSVDAGTVKLVIRAKGKQKRRLVGNGRVTVKPKITYTPSGGTATVEKKKVKLRRK